MEVQHIGPFILGKTLGVGSTGKVKLGIHKDTGQKVAIKIVKKEFLESKPSLRKKVEREIAVMKLIDHPNVLRLFDVFETISHLFLVLEHIEGGELFDYLVKKGRLDPQEAHRFFRQILSGLHYCHKQLICHRDLKPENLLLDSHMSIKIADFGMASMMKDGVLLETSCGSPHYASPEIVMGTKYNGMEADVWSCGVVLYALLTGKLPFDDENMQRLLGKVRSGIFSMPPSLDPDAKDLVWKMLTVDPTKRITIDQIRKHPWYVKYLKPGEVDEEREADPPPNDPLQDWSMVDVEILRTLKTLGWGSDEELKKALTTDEQNLEKVFYRLLERRKVERMISSTYVAKGKAAAATPSQAQGCSSASASRKHEQALSTSTEAASAPAARHLSEPADPTSADAASERTAAATHLSAPGGPGDHSLPDAVLDRLESVLGPLSAAPSQQYDVPTMRLEHSRAAAQAASTRAADSGLLKPPGSHIAPPATGAAAPLDAPATAITLSPSSPASPSNEAEQPPNFALDDSPLDKASASDKDSTLSPRYAGDSESASPGMNGGASMRRSLEAQRLGRLFTGPKWMSKSLKRGGPDGQQLASPPDDELTPAPSRSWFASLFGMGSQDTANKQDSLMYGLHSDKAHEALLHEIHRVLASMSIEWHMHNMFSMEAVLNDSFQESPAQKLKMQIELKPIGDGTILIRFQKLSGETARFRQMYERISKEMSL
mmetsp:Transcript_21187/g.36379  ORF Transcript_21187/g.36379 Transcript_21187/m.36379 type:complete len:717 (+) Transcript_21187:149-2299(+)